MAKSHQRAVTSANQAKPFIPNIYIQIAGNASIGSAYCKKDKIQWFYLIRQKRGFSDFEEVRCSCCGGELFRGKSLPSGFSSSESLEVIAWLEDHPKKEKTLILAVTPSNLETVENVLQNIFQKHFSSGKYLKVDVMENGYPLSRLRHGKKEQEGNSLLSIRKKRLCMASLLKTIQIEKTKKLKKGKDTRLVEKLKERVTQQESPKSKNLMKLSVSAKEALKRLGKNSPGTLKQHRLFLKKQKKLCTQNLQKFSRKDMLDLGRKLNKNFVKQKLRPTLYSVCLNPSLLRRLEAAHLLDMDKGGIGRISRRDWVLIIRRV